MGSNLHYLIIFLILSLLITNVYSHDKKVFDINTYGARPDGKTDSTQAVFRAWTDACRTNGGGAVLIPIGNYLVNPVILKGNCVGPMDFILKGNLLARLYSPQLGDSDHWITFQYVDNLVITGGGAFDGRGASAWPFNDCNKNPRCKKLPVSLRLDFVRNMKMSNIKLLNSQNFHMNVFACQNVELRKVNINAPGNSINTDGIHVAKTDGFKIFNSVIATGDDCLSFGPGSLRVEIVDVRCGPGHGISIGSLGGSPGEDDVAHFSVRDCNFVGTDNGVRIKTWSPSHPGRVYNLTFDHNTMVNVNNPIIIDQQYCPSGQCSHQGPSQVQISDVKFRRIWGTSSSKSAVTLNCSSSHPCKGIELNDIRLQYRGNDGSVDSQCSNAKGVAIGIQQPSSCLS